MNVDKVNATLLRAVTLFKEDEMKLTRAADSGNVSDLTGLELPLASMARDVAQQSGKPFAEALDAVIEATSAEASRRFGADVTEETLIEWLNSPTAGSIAQGVAEQL